MATPRRWLVPAALTVFAVSALALLGYGTYVWRTGNSEERRPSDARACARSRVPLQEAVDHFGLTLPPDAAEVHYDSTAHPMFGTYELRISFRMTSTELAHFLTKSGLPKPSTPDAFSVGEDFEAPSCANTLPESYLYSADSPDASLGYERKVLIGNPAKGELAVLINADDIDY